MDFKLTTNSITMASKFKHSLISNPFEVKVIKSFVHRTGLGFDSKWFLVEVYDPFLEEELIGSFYADETTIASILKNDPIIRPDNSESAKKALIFGSSFGPESTLLISNSEVIISRCEFMDRSFVSLCGDLNREFFKNRMNFDNHEGSTIEVNACIFWPGSTLVVSHDKVNLQALIIRKSNKVEISTSYDKIYFTEEAAKRIRDGEHSLYPSVQIIDSVVSENTEDKYGKMSITTCPVFKSDMKSSTSEAVDHYLEEISSLKDFEVGNLEPGFIIAGAWLNIHGEEMHLIQEWTKDSCSSARTVIFKSKLAENILLRNVAAIILGNLLDTEIRGNATILSKAVWHRNIDVVD